MSKHKHRTNHNTQQCPICKRTHDATGSICRHCADTLRRSLVDLSAHYADADTVRAGQVRYGNGTGTRSGPVRLGMDLRFATGGYGTRVLAEVHNMLVGWVRIGVGEHPSWPWPADTVPAMCAWLHARVAWLRSSVHGPLAYEQVHAALTSLRSLVDRPADRWYAGICGHQLDDATTCKAELRPRKPEGSLRCPACGTVHDIAGRRKLLLEEAMDRALPAADVARALCWLGEVSRNADSLSSRIRAWASKGRLVPWTHDVRRGLDGRVEMRPCYRVRDVVDLVEEDAKAEARRAEKRTGRRRSA